MYINKIDQSNITSIYSQIELLFILNIIKEDLSLIFFNMLCNLNKYMSIMYYIVCIIMYYIWCRSLDC